jgi:Dyp-type peroxidase family
MFRTLRWPRARRESGVRHDDIQGNVIRPYALSLTAHQFLQFPDAARGRAWLNQMLASVTTAERWDSKPTYSCNVAFTFSGLCALRTPATVLASFPTAFRDGMAARADLLGDTGSCAPSTWEEGFGTGAAHVLVTTHALDPTALSERLDQLRVLAVAHGVGILSEHQGARLPDSKEHFGYVDGIGQPALANSGVPTYGEGDVGMFERWHNVPAGEIFHGHIDDDGYPSPAPPAPFGHNGTFVVWRKLQQDVARFRTWIHEQASSLGMDESLLRAKLMGRWDDGTPLALSPEGPNTAIASDADRRNAFDYRDDPDGFRCPLGAHIRRTNPRASLGFGDALTGRHRILRRGTTYGPPLPPGVTVDDGQDRGIFFVAFMADIERQYELIQRVWCNDGDTVGVGHDPDPIVGRPIVTGEHKMTIPGPTPRFVSPLAQVVTTRGGEYLWMPSITALRALASL